MYIIFYDSSQLICFYIIHHTVEICFVPQKNNLSAIEVYGVITTTLLVLVRLGYHNPHEVHEAD